METYLTYQTQPTKLDMLYLEMVKPKYVIRKSENLEKILR